MLLVQQTKTPALLAIQGLISQEQPVTNVLVPAQLVLITLQLVQAVWLGIIFQETHASNAQIYAKLVKSNRICVHLA